MRLKEAASNNGNAALTLVLLLSLIFGGDFSEPAAANNERKAQPIAKKNKNQNDARLANGLYLVVRQSKDKKDIEPVKAGELAVLYDYKLLEPAEREAPRFVVLNTEKFIPLSLSEQPGKKEDLKGKPMLHLSLSQDQIKPLEEFTETNKGGTIAIVIGGNIVTMHKIKEKITGGKIQITRCSDSGCAVLFTELEKDRKRTSTN